MAIFTWNMQQIKLNYLYSFITEVQSVRIHPGIPCSEAWDSVGEHCSCAWNSAVKGCNSHSDAPLLLSWLLLWSNHFISVCFQILSKLLSFLLVHHAVRVVMLCVFMVGSALYLEESLSCLSYIWGTVNVGLWAWEGVLGRMLEGEGPGKHLGM